MNITIIFDPDKKEDVARVVAILEPFIGDAKTPDDGDVPLSVLLEHGIGARACNALKCTTVREARGLTKGQAMQFRGFGYQSWLDLQKAIRRYDAKVSGTSPERDTES